MILALLLIAAPGTLVLVDDRAIKDQAPPAFIDKTISELSRRKGFVPVRLSVARKQLDEREDADLASCGEDAGCLATAARALDAKLVVTVRVTKFEGDASFLAVTRINALRPQASDDSGTLSATDAASFAAIPAAVAELFPEVELLAPGAPPAPPPSPPSQTSPPAPPPPPAPKPAAAPAPTRPG